MHLPESPITPSTRHRVVDDQLAAVLEKDFGIPTAFILRALEGEPHQPAIALCRLATRFEERNGTLLMLARKFGRGRARRQRTAATPARGHGEISGRPRTDARCYSRGRDTPERLDVAPDSLQGCGPEFLPARPGAS
jgi:hypothetical protein